MKAYAIYVDGNTVSESGLDRLIKSSIQVSNEFIVEPWPGVTPKNCHEKLSFHDIRWNYPWEGEVIDFASGLTKKAYPTQNPDARISCALSHYILWKIASKDEEPTLIMEHDAIFTKKIDFNPHITRHQIIGINNPLGCTRLSRLFAEKVERLEAEYQYTPWIDSQSVPQGLAGNSAYIIKPEGAKQMLELVDRYGLWPNDAIMCRQLFPLLGVTKTHYTWIQGLRSTTTL